MKKKTAWMKGLSKKLVQQILDLEPERVEKIIDRKHKGVYFYIYLPSQSVARGLSICSITEAFNEERGLNKAAGRAVKAALTEKDSEPIRCNFEDFPNSWSKKQIAHLLDFAEFYGKKSKFYKVGTIMASKTEEE